MEKKVVNCVRNKVEQVSEESGSYGWFFGLHPLKWHGSNSPSKHFITAY